MPDKDDEFDFYPMDYGGMRRRYRAPVAPRGINNAIIANFSPHYTDDYYKKARLIWGSEKADFWAYSDRIGQWHKSKVLMAASKQCEEEGLKPRTSAYVQRWLQLINKDDGLVLQGIMAGHNLANGFPYQVYGYKMSKDEKE